MIAVYAPAAKQVTIDLYQQMGEKGLLTQEDRVQLIEGEILEMPPVGNRRGIDAYSDPASGGFRGAAKFRVQDTIWPRAFPQVRTLVKELFVDPDER